jgi:tetratricopeptide (TPR) repeat protein
MKSFYELLGASADDDAEALNRAFRKAVKAHHPDLHPTDPDAQVRFRQIIAAGAVLRDAKQRATYDWLLQVERERFQLTLARRQLRSKLAHPQLRLKRMRTTAAIAAIGALIGGYGLWALMPTIAVVEINKDEQAAAGVATVQEDRQTATVIAPAQRNENTPTVIAAAEDARTGIAAPEADAVKGNADRAAEPIETAGAQLMQSVGALVRGEPRDKHDDGEVRNGASTPSADAPTTDSVSAPVITGSEAAPGAITNDSNFYRERGIAAYRGGDFLGAIGNFDEAIRLNRDDAQSYNIRGNVWDELGIYERALDDYDDAIRISPNPAVFHDRAIFWQRKGELDKALIDLDRAIRFSFSDASTYCDRGLVWYEKGRHDRAVADFNRAIKLDPNFAPACIKHGLIVHRNGESELALAAVNRVIRVDPSIFDAIRQANSRP